MPDRSSVFSLVAGCTDCELHENCNGPVPFRGDPARVVVVGEAPGEEEDRLGRPFVGPSGHLLEDLFAEVGLIEPVAYCNTASCWPHGSPGPAHIHACTGNKWAQINYLNPTYILLLGKVALQAMVPQLEIKRARARPFLAGHPERLCWATYHPAAGLRNRAYLDAMRTDLAAFVAFLDVGRGQWTNFIPDECAGCAAEATWYDYSMLGWCRLHLPGHLIGAYEARQALLVADVDGARRRSADRRDAALSAVEAAADPDWMTLAWDALVGWLKTHPEFFVDDWWHGTGITEPRESRALGPVVMRAAREGLMEKTGQFRKSARSNMTEKPVWRSLIHRPRPSGQDARS